MANIDLDLYNKLVTEQDSEQLIENLLAYHSYQEDKLDIVARYYQKNGKFPTDNYIRRVVTSPNVIDKYKISGKTILAKTINKELSKNDKKRSPFGEFVSRTMSSLASRIIFEILILLVTYAIIKFGFSDLVNSLKTKFQLP